MDHIDHIDHLDTSFRVVDWLKGNLSPSYTHPSGKNCSYTFDKRPTCIQGLVGGDTSPDDVLVWPLGLGSNSTQTLWSLKK